MYRGVLELDGLVFEYSGPYDTPAKARSSVTHWVKVGGYNGRRSGYIQTAQPLWEFVE